MNVIGYLSPVSDAYKKVSDNSRRSSCIVAWHFANPCHQAGLASAEHRLRMCEIAVEVSPKSLADSRSIKFS